MNENVNDDIKETVMHSKDNEEILDLTKRWEHLKYQIKQKFMHTSKTIKKIRKHEMENKAREVKKREKLVSKDSNNAGLKERPKCLEADLINMHEEYIKSVMVRTRALWVAEGEKN